MRTVLLAELRFNARRALASGIAILISVAFIAIVLGVTATAKEFGQDIAAGPLTGVDVVVSADPSGRYPGLMKSEISALEKVPGISSQSIAWTAPASSTSGAKKNFSIVSLPVTKSLKWHKVLSGTEPKAGEVAVTEQVAAAQKLRVGEKIIFRDNRQVTVSGIISSPTPIPNSSTLLAPATDMQSWIPEESQTKDPGTTLPVRVILSAKPGTSPEKLVAAVSAKLTNARVDTTTDYRSWAGENLTGGVDILGRILLAFTAVALFVCLLVIGNIFTILLAHRTQQLALLRCLGATRKQLQQAAFIEAAILGSAASVTGTFFGIVLVFAGTKVLPHFFDGATGIQSVITFNMVLVPLLTGPLVTLAATLGPIRRATRIAPLAALRPESPLRTRMVSRVRRISAVLLAGLSAGLLFFATVVGGTLGILLAVAGGISLGTAVLLPAPVLVPAISRLLAKPTQRFGPIAELAVNNTVRNPRRAAATAVALFIGVSLMAMVGTGAATIERAAKTEIDDAYPLDVQVYAGESGGNFTADQLTKIDRVPGVTAVAGMYSDWVTIRGQGWLFYDVTNPGLQELSSFTSTNPPPVGITEPSQVGLQKTPDVEGLISKIPRDAVWFLGGDFAKYRAVSRTTLILGNGQKDLRPGEIGVSPGAAKAAHGSTWTIRSGKNSITVTPVAVRQANGKKLESLELRPLLTDSDMTKLGFPTGYSQIYARTVNDIDPVKLAEDLDAIQPPGAAWDVQGSFTERANLQSVLGIMTNIATGLLAVAIVVAFIGLANTLALSVLERAQETGLLRALGVTRRQVRQMFGAEAVLLALTGCVLGVAVGVLLGYVGAVAVLADQVSSVPWPDVQFWMLAMIVLLALLAAVAASTLPGRRAANIPPTVALAQR